MMDELLAAWEQYIDWHDNMVGVAYPPSLTSFMAWYKNTRELEVKNPEQKTRTEPTSHTYTTRERNLHITTGVEVSQEPASKDAKRRLAKGLTIDEVSSVRELYEQGFSLARIRQALDLDVTLNRLQTVVNKPW